jgi:hypothetical protein
VTTIAKSGFLPPTAICSRRLRSRTIVARPLTRRVSCFPGMRKKSPTRSFCRMFLNVSTRGLPEIGHPRLERIPRIPFGGYIHSPFPVSGDRDWSIRHGFSARWFNLHAPRSSSAIRVVDRRRELAIHLENPFPCVLECLQSYDRF